MNYRDGYTNIEEANGIMAIGKHQREKATVIGKSRMMHKVVKDRLTCYAETRQSFGI